MGCISLTSITLPDTVTTIAPGAFSNFIQLESCVFPENPQFTKISKETFKGCTKLEEVLISSSVTEIAESAFQGCTNLKRVVLSNNLNTIGSMAFKDASLMEGVYIPASLSSIPENNQIFKGMANNSVIYLGSSDLISLMLQSKADPTSTSNGKRFVKGVLPFSNELRHKQYHIFIMLFDHNQSGTDCGLYFENDIFPLNKGINRRCVFRQYLP